MLLQPRISSTKSQMFKQKKYKTITLAKNNAGVIFVKKRKNKKANDDLGNTREIIDLSKFIYPDMVNLDTNGSYTGMTEDTYYNGELEEPIQDADDL